MRKKGLQYKSVVIINNVCRITIYSNKHGCVEVLVDEEDFDRIVSIGWSIVKPKKVLYAIGWYKIGNQRKHTSMHRFILNHPKGIVDHRDMNGLNNTKSNLRIATPSQSAANRNIFADEFIKWKGVSYLKHKKLYVVQLSKDNKTMNFGRFKNVLLAAAKYNEMALKYHGEFANLNRFSKEEESEINNPPKETRRISKNNTTGYYGVSFAKNGYSNPYKATIYVNGKNKHLGVFDDPILAAKSYNEAAIKYHREKASLNILP